MVRMGEHAVSRDAGDVLVSLGLGSCIGLALVDPQARVAGLAHVVLPASDGRTDAAGRYADTAPGVLIAEMLALGARRTGLTAVLAGGASMLASRTGGLEVGMRNAAAVRAALERLRIPIAAAETGGRHGRTIRVVVESSEVSVRAAGGETIQVYSGRRPAAGRRA